MLASVLAASTVTSLAVVRPAHADDVDLSSYFRLGVEAYQRGQVAEAIRYWEAVYTQAGAKRGYRVAFNLARAYAVFGDTTQSAEHYEAFLAEVDAQRKDHATVDATVEKEAGEARAELESLKAKNGRLRVVAANPPIAVSVDAASARVAGFTSYVTPGVHRVVFAPGTPTETVRTVTVTAGEVVEAQPPQAPAPPVTPVTPPPPERRLGEAARAAPPATYHTERPFSPVVLAVASSVTVVSVLVPIVTYAKARKDRDTAQNDETAGQAVYGPAQQTYQSARTTAYATLAVPLGLAAVTLGLTSWYLAGTRQVEDPRPATSQRHAPSWSPTVTPAPGGATLGATGTF